MKTQLIQAMGSFVLGGSVVLGSLYAWLGTSDLQEIKDSVRNYIVESEQHASQLLGEYNVTVDQANAEIQDYKDALAQANDNISQLITAYEDKVTELEQANQQAQDDLAEVYQAYNDMQTRLDRQYETDMNAIIEQANAEINQANIEVAETKEQVLSDLETSQVDEIVNGDKHQLDTTGDKSVQDISSVLPQE